MLHKFYVTTYMKMILVFSAIFFVISNAAIWRTTKVTSLEIPGGIVPLVIMDLILIAMVLWRIKTPVLVLSETGLTLNIPFIFKRKSARWTDIIGMVMGETSTFGVKEENIKFLLRSVKGASNEMLVSLKAIDKPKELISILKKRVPETGYEQLKDDIVKIKDPKAKEVKYLKWVLSEEGLKNSQGLINWNEISSISYQGLVISGFGSTTIKYIKDGKERTITVPPKSSAVYQDFIRYLVSHSKKATIDPGLLKVIEYSPKAAGQDILPIVFSLLGFILSFSSLFFFTYYSPTVNSGFAYALLIIPLGFLPIIMSFKSLSARFRGETESSSKKFHWSIFASIGPITALLLFFIISPFSFNWFAGDLNRKAEKFEQAIHYYNEALRHYPESIDIPYDLGKLHREREEWKEAFTNLEQAYTMDPTYWGPLAVVLLPDTLMKMGKHDEALLWCDKILEDLPGKIDIKKAIEKKRDEIINNKNSISKEEIR